MQVMEAYIIITLIKHKNQFNPMKNKAIAIDSSIVKRKLLHNQLTDNNSPYLYALNS
jgi:hypothetical protein